MRRQTICITFLAAFALAACARAGATATPTYSPQAETAAGLVAEGDARLAQSDFAGAEAAYQKASAVDPNYAPAYSHLAYAHLFHPATQPAALDEARQATELDPSSAEAWAYLARAYDWNSRFDEALEAAEKAARLDADNATVQSFLGEVYADLRRYDDALKAAEKAVRLDPQNAEAHRNLGYVYDFMSRREDALAEYRQALDLEPQFVHRLTSLAAHYLYSADDPEAARQRLDEALALAPDDYIARLFRARMASGQGRLDEAVADCQKILALAPDAAEGHDCLGGVYLDARDFESAEAERQAAIAADPNDSSSHIGLAYVYYVWGKCPEALTQFQKAADLFPQSGEARAGVGLAYQCTGEPDKAEAAFKQAAELEPYDGSHHVRLARLYLSLGRFRDAEREFQKAIDILPDEDQFVAALGEAYMAEGDAPRAIAQYQQAAELDPDDPAHALAIGVAYLRSGDFAAAADHFQQTLDIYDREGATAGEIAQANYGLALTYIARSDCVSAVPRLQEAARLDPSLEEARDYLLQCRQVVGLAQTPLPPELTDSGPLGHEAAVTLLVNSLAALGIQSDVGFQTTQDGSPMLVVAYVATTQPGSPEFVAERSPVVFAAAWMLARLVPEVDGALVVSANVQGDVFAYLSTATRTARWWAAGLLTDAGFAGTWREVSP